MIVVDASVINKLFLSNEDGREQVKSILGSHISGLNKIIVPDLLFYEVANTLTTKTQVSQSIAVRSLKELYSFNFEVINPSEDILRTAIKFAKRYKISVYDASYAVLAKQKKCKLITADEKFVNQVKLKFVKQL